MGSFLTSGSFMLLYLKSHYSWILSSELYVPKFSFHITASVKINGGSALGLFYVANMKDVYPAYSHEECLQYFYSFIIF